MARKEERSDTIPESTDVAVIGAGPGGYAAAFEAAAQGLDVTLISDEERVGGVCLLRGCIPSKTLLHVTELMHATQAAGTMGVTFEPPRIDPDELRDWKDRIIVELTDGLAELCKQRRVRLVRARARFAGDQQLQLEGAERESLRYEHAIIATGTRPTALPDVDFSQSGRIMDSTGALALEEIPKSLLVVGGGYVGLEMGMVYQALGSRVTLVEMADRLMANADADLVEPLAAKVEKLFDSVRLNTQVSGLKETRKQVKVTLEGDDGKQDKNFERVLIAVGRQPNTENLGLDETSVTCDDKGFIEVDETRRTGDERIYAIGDVAGGMLLAHEDGMTKLIVEPQSGRILGMGVVGPQAESLIAEGALAVEMGAVAEDLALTVHPHPTLSETVGECAELFLGKATHYG